MAAGSLARDRVQVHEHGARDVPAKVGVATLAAGEVPAEVDDAEVGIADLLSEPLWCHQRTEGAHWAVVTTRVSWQKCTA